MVLLEESGALSTQLLQVPGTFCGEALWAFPLAQVEVLSATSRLGTQAIEQECTQESEFRKINHFFCFVKDILSNWPFLKSVSA